MYILIWLYLILNNVEFIKSQPNSATSNYCYVNNCKICYNDRCFSCEENYKIDYSENKCLPHPPTSGLKSSDSIISMNTIHFPNVLRKLFKSF